MPYYFIDYRPAVAGQDPEPDCPAGTNCLILADLEGLGWGLCEIPENEDWQPTLHVSAELACLIESGKRFPPALAVAREEMAQVFVEHKPTHDEFAQAYTRALQAGLSRQHESVYILAEAVKDEPGFLVRGQWYWVLEISSSPTEAFWVSEDYYICKAGMNDFDFTGQQLKRLGYVG